MGKFPLMPRALPAATVLAVLALAGCGEKSEPEVDTSASATSTTSAATTSTTATSGGGGGGGGQQADPEQLVNVAIVAVLGGRDPAAACSELATEDYVKKSYGDEQGCRAAVNKRGAFSVDVTQVKVDGKQATAKAKPAAGPNKGETITVDLVQEGDTWKVDKALSNAPPGP